ncbi:bifunctional cobalt-precorrin-7 (C(5))-methyltransferase/cobalt-precorrin-6B (C(15))-methyltransferase [Methanoregula formicica]|uniref:Precorrin-6B methylase 2 n=1 Tax=Methanoregula formicica (strain DSM 22288 / NBRC 105244 / SMSP) TaxID=593750 RepID=L0HGQ6_METFS|nr:methyltransferase domain-containing protein [Methanoregula formicica]AGB02513.1 precorrin-6B methylase 2 [Methanoregula formicica SMSP]
MPAKRLPGGPTQDEIMAISLLKLDIHKTDSLLEIGCGTGRVTLALATLGKCVDAIDVRPEAVDLARQTAKDRGVKNITFTCAEATEFLESNKVYTSAFVGGTKNLREILPVLAKRVRWKIVINAVLLSTVCEAVSTLQELGLFVEVVQVQVSRSKPLAGSLMFKPIDPVYIIVGRGSACS